MTDSKAKAVAVADVSPLRALLEMIAADGDNLKHMPIEVVERMWAMQKQYDDRDAVRQYNEAFARFQADCPIVEKNKTVDGKYNYADLPQIKRTIRDYLVNNGLSYKYRTEHPSDNVLRVWCIVSHVGGHFEESYVDVPCLPPNKLVNNAQAAGSTNEYGRRYSLQNALGLSTSDDDDARSVMVDANYERVSENQAADLESLLIDAGANMSAFVAWASKSSGVKVESISELPSAFYSRAVNMAQRKLRNA